ncbi:MAG: response regulator transcription factor, partial [Alphaproteobacteria bacterium]|nr:response regulator transcription factor [Alphaproteobacteria bacterium]
MSPKPLICIVDDDEAVRDSLQFLLTGAGFRVQSFASGSAFLDEFDASDTDCVLLDILLDDINGLEVLERLAEKGVRVPVVMITGNADVSTAVRAMKAGAADFIEKPYSDELIFSTIQRACDAADQARHNCPPDNPVEARIAELTPRERDVLEHMVIGRPNKITAYELGIS